MSARESLRKRFVRSIWATHNDSAQIQAALKLCLSRLGPGTRGLNVGAGSTRLHPAVMNLDIVSTPTVDVCASVDQLPFRDEVFDLVLSQEVLEHVPNPFRGISEMKRVLRRGGILYCQVPFTIGYHPGPTDFWRFTIQGIRELVQREGLEVQQLDIAVGPGTGFYRIAVEFIATGASRLWPSLYFPFKALMALFLYPFKWYDSFLIKAPQKDRIAGGYFVICRRR